MGRTKSKNRTQIIANNMKKKEVSLRVMSVGNKDSLLHWRTFRKNLFSNLVKNVFKVFIYS